MQRMGNQDIQRKTDGSPGGKFGVSGFYERNQGKFIGYDSLSSIAYLWEC